MRVVVSVEARLSRTRDGRVWSLTPPIRSFWDRYLTVFDTVRVLARVHEVAAVPDGARRVDGDGVEVWPVPCYVGPSQFVGRAAAVRRAVLAAAGPGDAVIARAPSAIGTLLTRHRSRRGYPFAVEVVGDPDTVFAPGVVRHPLRPAFRYWYTRQLRWMCRSADAVAYVTDHVLQSRYPAAMGAVTASYSSVELPPEAFAARHRVGGGGASHLVSIGSLDQPYKGIDTLIRALPLLAVRRPIHLTHIGDGRCRPALERLAADCGVADRVCFAGRVPAGAAVRDLLDRADLFVMPSRTEGQGRALIEAMARGLPAVGSAVGGIIELLDPPFLVPPDRPDALARRIADLLDDPKRCRQAAADNLERARGFATDQLTPRRTAFYRAVRETVSRETAAVQ
jgi:glycosyltransferase involved in cell wall biosynthesis